MSLISIVLSLIVIGVVLRLINRYIPMANSIKIILNWVIAAFVFFWLLSVFGLTQNFNNLMHGLGDFFSQTITVPATQATKT